MIEWCDNVLSVHGPGWQEFRDRVAGVDSDGTPVELSLAALRPVPDGLDPESAVAWCDEHWGSGAEASDVESFEDDEAIRYRFITALTPIEPWLAEASLRWTGLTFTYVVMRADIKLCGVIVYAQGRFAGGEMVDAELPMDEWRAGAQELLESIGAPELMESLAA